MFFHLKEFLTSHSKKMPNKNLSNIFNEDSRNLLGKWVRINLLKK